MILGKNRSPLIVVNTLREKYLTVVWQVEESNWITTCSSDHTYQASHKYREKPECENSTSAYDMQIQINLSKDKQNDS